MSDPTKETLDGSIPDAMFEARGTVLTKLAELVPGSQIVELPLDATINNRFGTKAIKFGEDLIAYTGLSKEQLRTPGMIHKNFEEMNKAIDAIEQFQQTLGIKSLVILGDYSNGTVSLPKNVRHEAETQLSKPFLKKVIADSGIGQGVLDLFAKIVIRNRGKLKIATMNNLENISKIIIGEA